MKQILIVLMLLGSFSSFAQSKHLISTAKKVVATRSAAEFEKALVYLKAEAEMVDSEILIFFNDIRLKSGLVRDVSDFIERSESRAASLKVLNDKGASLLKVAESFTAPLDAAKVSQVEQGMKNDNFHVEETKLPEYRNTAFNQELKRTAKIRAKLFFYY